jgi:pimeloyl-ACP methyl ester carboxylesterase
VFKRAGHFPHRDDPKRFVRVIDEFLVRAERPASRKVALGA